MKDLRGLHLGKNVSILIADAMSIPLLDYNIGLENFDEKIDYTTIYIMELDGRGKKIITSLVKWLLQIKINNIEGIW